MTDSALSCPTDSDAPEARFRPDGLGAVLGRLELLAAGQDRLTLQEIVEDMGSHSFAPVLMVPALLVFSPASAIPLLCSICGLTIALIAAQMLLGRRRLWLPGLLLRRSLGTAPLRRALRWLAGPAAWVDARTGRRLPMLARAPFSWLLLATCFCAGLVMPALELLPLTSSILGAAVVLIALSLMVRDGVLALLGLATTAGAAWAVRWFTAG